jgi:arylsulfatase A-like enzyme
LYDLGSDPEELKNLAREPKQAKRLARLRESLAAELKRTAAPAAMIPPKPSSGKAP